MQSGICIKNYSQRTGILGLLIWILKHSDNNWHWFWKLQTVITLLRNELETSFFFPRSQETNLFLLGSLGGHIKSLKGRSWPAGRHLMFTASKKLPITDMHSSLSLCTHNCKYMLKQGDSPTTISFTWAGELTGWHTLMGRLVPGPESCISYR